VQNYFMGRVFTDSKGGFMWRIYYRDMTLQQVLIMAYMNTLEAVSFAPAS